MLCFHDTDWRQSGKAQTFKNISNHVIFAVLFYTYFVIPKSSDT